LLQQTNKNNATSTYTTAEAIEFIRLAFDADGFLIKPKSRKNKATARAILDSGLNLYQVYVDGYHAHDAMLIIAYPDRDI
jgi:hypothetical protein